MQKVRKLSLQTKIGYGVGQFSEGVAYNFFYFFYTYFLVTVVGLNPAIAGGLSGFAVLWDALTDPLIGYLSDRCRSRRGKRRAFIGKAAVPLGMMVALICYTPPLDGVLLVVYLALVNILFWMMFTACDIPWIALGNEISSDFDEKSSLRSISTGFMVLGQLVASGLSLPLVSWLCTVVISERVAWAILGVLLGVLVALGFLVSYLSTKGMDAPSLAKDRGGLGSFLAQFRACWGIKGVRSLFFMALTACTCTGIFLSGEVFYLEIFFSLDDYAISVINIVCALVSFVLTYYVGWLAAKFDKKNVLMAHFLLAAVGFLVLWLVPGTPFSMVGTLLLFYVADMTFWTVVFSVLSDVTELHAYRDAESDVAGSATGLISLGIKIGTAFGMWLLGVGLDLIGYSEVAAASSGLQAAFGSMFYLPLALFYALAFVSVFVYPYTRKAYQSEKADLGREGR